MIIPLDKWQDYVNKLAAINEEAAASVRALGKIRSMQNITAYLNRLQTIINVYGEAAAALSCEMYDLLAELNGVAVPPAVPAEITPPEVVERAVRAAVIEDVEEQIPAIVGRYVKQAGADTTLQNAQRDGAEWAWIPSGDTCAFCLVLSSRGWQRQSKKAAKAHAEHIHNHCNCTYTVRFDGEGGVEGYDPDIYKQLYYKNPDGTDREGTPKDKIKAIRREGYEGNERLKAQKHDYYEKNKERLKAQRLQKQREAQENKGNT